MKLGVMASGKLGAVVVRHLVKEKEIAFVMTDNDSGEIVNICEQHNYPVFIGNPRNNKCKNFLSEKKIDVLISVNYLFLIEEDVISLPSKIAFNIHGSLLPKYRGRTPHVWAIINNEKEVGITAHVIDKGCDTGDIIEQIPVPVEPTDTGASILKKYQQLYIPLIDSVLGKISKDSVQLVPQDHNKATYFGKRSPEDGRINWDWQRERINNWVRSQAFPYPGAFSLYKDQKITIDEIHFEEYAYDYEMPNGLILSTDPILIKTPNGVVNIKKTRGIKDEIEAGQILK